MVTIVDIRHSNGIGISGRDLISFFPIPHIRGFTAGRERVGSDSSRMRSFTEEIRNSGVNRLRRNREVVNRGVLGLTTVAVHLDIELISECVRQTREIRAVDSKAVRRICSTHDKLSVASPLVGGSDVVVLNLRCEGNHSTFAGVVRTNDIHHNTFRHGKNHDVGSVGVDIGHRLTFDLVCSRSQTATDQLESGTRTVLLKRTIHVPFVGGHALTRGQSAHCNGVCSRRCRSGQTDALGLSRRDGHHHLIHSFQIHEIRMR